MHADKLYKTNWLKFEASADVVIFNHYLIKTTMLIT